MKPRYRWQADCACWVLSHDLRSVLPCWPTFLLSGWPAYLLPALPALPRVDDFHIEWLARRREIWSQSDDFVQPLWRRET